MSSSQYRNQLNNKRKQRLEAEKKAGEYRTKESNFRSDAAALRLAASKTSSASTAKSKLSEAARKDKSAEDAGKQANSWQRRASTYAKEEQALALNLSKAEASETAAAERKRQSDAAAAERKRKSEADAAERKRKRDEQQAARQQAAFESRIAQTETAVEHVLRQLPAPKPEKLRVLLLGAASKGDLRVGREQQRIRSAVESALGRDQIEFDVRTAATTADLLDGITKFRPHVVHFSGHSNEDFIEFEADEDARHIGIAVTARAFARAVKATDTPPLLVLLNSCKSAAQIEDLVAEVAPFAIGMADEISDGDAINYAAQFYAAIANGQSINSAHLSGQAALELTGLEGADLPTLAWAEDVDPTTTLLVKAMG
ncbi:hypothetical protein IU459_32920 [Nocardia amamiensis]|uniref:CHAT domain-containing protein n=1 Tax=Nocardia amamiensis TaxID=404578 RepID=A0ABS0D568_9NOCA|nr:hypothetical protein [Nocardia amamiensis]MBF6302309.1 hypothetical protein [Nocardia amamiensis]